MLVDDPKVHEQVRAQCLELEVAALYVERGLITNNAQQGLQQAAVAETFRRSQLGRDARRALRQRNETRTRSLVQALEQRQQLVLEHSRDQPFAAILVDLVEHEDWNRQAQAIARVTGLVQVLRLAVDSAQTQRTRKGAGRDSRRLVAHQFVARERQQLRSATHFLAVPALQAVATADLRRKLLIVKGVDQFVVHQHILAARLVL